MQVMVIPKNEDSPPKRWVAWSGKSPVEALIYFNQNDVPQMASSIPYVVNDLARPLKRMTPQIQPVFNVPFPGVGQMEAIIAGTHDTMYRKLFTDSMGVFDSSSNGRVKFRIAWEFNLDTSDQTNKAKDKTGAFNPTMYRAAYRRIAGIARSVSPRPWLIWCPNHGKGQSFDFADYYPGDDVVDEIGIDFYFQKRFGAQTAAWAIAPASGFGFQWLVDFARLRKKPWCVPEIGADSDAVAPEFDKLLSWLDLNGCRWIGYWDRWEVINCQISTGVLPAIGAVVRKYL